AGTVPIRGPAKGRFLGRPPGGDSPDFSEREQGEGVLVLAVHAEEIVDFAVDEAGVEPWLESVGRREREQVREHRPGVPPDMPVAAFEVFPAGPPVDASNHDDRFSVRKLELRSGSRDDVPRIVTA